MRAWTDVKHILFRFIQKYFFRWRNCFFNLFLKLFLEASGGKSISNLLHFLKYTIWFRFWRIRNSFWKHYTLRENDFSGYIQRRLDYISVYYALQESLQQTSILRSFCSGYSLILVSYNKSTQISLDDGSQCKTKRLI